MKINNGISINYILSLSNDNSNAAVNRIKLFKKGIISNGHICNIYFTDTNNTHNPYFNKLVSFFRLLKIFLKANKNEVFIFYGNSYNNIFILLFNWKFKLYVERNEYPYYLINSDFNKFREKNKEKFLNYLLRYTNGLITCSNVLKEYYKQFLKHDHIHISPLIVDLNKFENGKEDTVFEFKYIAYIGSLGNNKDGVPNLIKSFLLIQKEFPEMKLVIVGNTKVKEFKEINKLVIDNKLESKVVFTGAVNNDLVPSILKKASLLVLARPDNKQAEGGIPSKVGEYMASKVPIVITNVGELNFFLIDGINCFMAQPDSIEDFADKMKVALNYEDKSIIVENAFETAKRFDVVNQSKKLIDFILSN